MLLGALEAGGTKMVYAIGNEEGKILERHTIPTETPSITIPKMIAFFKQHDIDALGIGSFGPVDLHPASPTYGHITTTPKLAWANCDLVGAFKKELSVPIGFDTDVNASALGEATWGCTQNLHTSLYITVGTGVGVGIYQNGDLLHGMLHPEAGHILLAKHPEDTYGGKCPYHPNCLESLAAGPAIEDRWGKKAYDLKPDSKVWELEAFYIAQALVNYILTVMPNRIVLGGGVMHQEQLFPLIRKEVHRLLNGYIQTKELADLDTYIVPPSLNDDQGLMGCLQLAIRSLNK